MPDGGLPEELRSWVEASVGGAVVHADRHLAGASRQAWAVDVERDSAPLQLFLLRDVGRGGGSARDAAVLTALAATEVPVPAVHTWDPELRAVLLERISGRSEFEDPGGDGKPDPTLRHLMEVVAALHRLDPSALEIAHLGTPDASADHAMAQLSAVEDVADLFGDSLHPLFAVAISWLRRTRPSGLGRTSIVHSDMGPGNLVHRDGRVRAILDWEVAHWGDPMEDLAALAVRDMATPVGDLRTRFAEYERWGGPAIDLRTVAWYRILILARNSMLIGLGLSFDDPTTDRAQLTMYRTLLMRAAALALCDAVGAPRPAEPPFQEAPPTDHLRLVAHAWRDIRDTVGPAVADDFARQRAVGAAGTLGTIDHQLRFGDDRDARELAGLAALLGHRPRTVAEGLLEIVALADEPGRAQDLVAYLARHLTREAMLSSPLLGDLADRVPQTLEER